MKKTLYLENSAGSSRRGDWAKDLDVEGVERVVVGLGPGSFAGVGSVSAEDAKCSGLLRRRRS